jgi:hypothetical protein
VAGGSDFLPTKVREPSSSGKRASMATAPRVSTGRSSLRYTSSVSRVLVWPTRWAMSSIGIPELDSSDTKLCRSSLGVQGHRVHPSRGGDAPEGSADVLRDQAGCRWSSRTRDRTPRAGVRFRHSASRPDSGASSGLRRSVPATRVCGVTWSSSCRRVLGQSSRVDGRRVVVEIDPRPG